MSRSPFDGNSAGLLTRWTLNGHSKATQKVAKRREKSFKDIVEAAQSPFLDLDNLQVESKLLNRLGQQFHVFLQSYIVHLCLKSLVSKYHSFPIY